MARILFDVEHDYVPRRIAVYGDGQTYERWHQTWNVESLQQVRDELADSLRWVVKSAVFVQPGRAHRMEILEMTLNARIDPALFTPEASPGTSIEDLTTQKRYVLRGRKAADDLVDRRIERARDEVAAADRGSAETTRAPTSYNARPSDSGTRWKVLGAISVVLLVVAYGFHVYRSSH